MAIPWGGTSSKPPILITRCFLGFDPQTYLKPLEVCPQKGGSHGKHVGQITEKGALNISFRKDKRR